MGTEVNLDVTEFQNMVLTNRAISSEDVLESLFRVDPVAGEYHIVDVNRDMVVCTCTKLSQVIKVVRSLELAARMQELKRLHREIDLLTD